MGKGKRILLGTVMTLLAAAVVVLGATIFRILSYLEETQQTFLQIEQEVVQEQLEETIGRSRQTLVTHIKKLRKENGGPIEEHSSSPNDPRKYYTVD